MNTSSAIEVTIHAGVAIVALNRPERLNAFTDRMEAELISEFDRCDEDDSVRAVVLTGAGRAFCAGMDTVDAGAAFDAWRAARTAPPGTQYDVTGHDLPMRRDGGGRVALRMFECRKPIIAAVNGPAVGVGATMILAADVRLAGDAAKFGYVFTRLGVVPESCSSWFLPRVVGMQTAMEWVLTGRMVGAREALDRGLVRSVHPSDELIPAALELAREIADGTAPVSVALARQMLLRMQGVDHPMAAHQVETRALNLRGLSDDAREGFAAVVEKRPASFRDRVSRDLPEVFSTLPAYQFDPTSMEDPS